MEFIVLFGVMVLNAQLYFISSSIDRHKKTMDSIAEQLNWIGASLDHLKKKGVWDEP